MTTAFLMVLGCAVATAAFVRWATRHAPEGYEDDKRGFVFRADVPEEGIAVEEDSGVPAAAASAVPSRSLGSRLSGPLGAG